MWRQWIFSIFFVFLSFELCAEGKDQVNLFEFAISDRQDAQILDFLKEIGVGNAYELLNYYKPNTSRTMLEGIIESVYETNPDILVSRDDIEIAKEKKRQALGNMLPKLSSSLSGNVRTQKHDRSKQETDQSASGSVTLTQPLFRGGSLYKNYAKNIEALKASEYASESVVQDFLLTALEAHLEVLEKLAISAVSRHSLEVLKRFDQETQARFQAKLVTKTDMSQSLARLKRASSNFDIEFAQYKRAREHFEWVVGLKADAAANIPEVAFKELIPFEELEKIVLLYHPLILEAGKQLEASKREIEVKFGVLLPSVDFVTTGSRNFKQGFSSEQYSGEAKIQIDVPLYSGGVDYSAYKQAKAEYQRAVNHLDRVRRHVREELNSVKHDYDVAAEIVDARFAEVQAARIAFEGSQKEYKAGKRTALDTLDSETDLLNANIDYIAANFNQKKLIFRYLKAMGCLSYRVLKEGLSL